MKLLRLKISENYKSINNFEYEFRENNEDDTHFSPICFVGLNGSGKSNIIEALSEIFCYLDLYILDYDKAPKWTKLSPLSFEIEYVLLIGADKVHVKVVSEKNKSPKFFTVDKNKIEKEEVISIALLPNRIIGYSSGHNESISYPYMKNQGFYAKEVLEIALHNKAAKPPHTLSLFMDYEINALILITNYLFSHDTSIFENNIRIDQPLTFQIRINLKKNIELTDELKKTIDMLHKVATIPGGDFKTLWELDFFLNDALKTAIQSLFKTAENFFTSLYKLSLLNALRLTAQERSFYIQRQKEDSLRERPPVVSKENKVFNIDKLKIKLLEPDIEIDYSGLSDGEHQFIHIFGTIMLFNEPNCLFLLDEPESHFNPQWRAKFINSVSQTLGKNNPEFILSTHSPYVISAARKEQVLKFSRKADVISYIEPTRETFGATFEDILSDLFEVKKPISAYSEEYINEKIKSNNLEKMREAISSLGESEDKLFLYDAIYDLENK